MNYYRNAKIEVYRAQIDALLDAIMDRAEAKDVDSVLALSGDIKHIYRLLKNLNEKEGKVNE